MDSARAQMYIDSASELSLTSNRYEIIQIDHIHMPYAIVDPFAIGSHVCVFVVEIYM